MTNSVSLMDAKSEAMLLPFCGFQNKEIVSHFSDKNKAKEDLYNLDKWQAYEEANPRAFGAMYQFWCQKVE